jgi:hypothetical protein
MVGAVSSPTDARYTPDDTPDPSAPSAPETSPSWAASQTLNNRYAIRGYIDTARKHHADIITAIRDALAGNPWMPPVPA